MFNHSQIMILFCSNPLRVNAKVLTRPYEMWPLNTSLTSQVSFACPAPPHLTHPMHTAPTILALSSVLTYQLHFHLSTLYYIKPTCPNPHLQYSLYLLSFHIFFYSNYYQTLYICTYLFIPLLTVRCKLHEDRNSDFWGILFSATKRMPSTLQIRNNIC